MTGMYVYQIAQPDSYLVIDVSDIRSKHDAMVIRDLLQKYVKIGSHVSMNDFDKDIRTMTGAYISMVSCDCHYPVYQTQREEIDYCIAHCSYDVLFMKLIDKENWIERYKEQETPMSMDNTWIWRNSQNC